MICAVILAAGRSRRMGAQKLLLPLGGKPVIARVVDEVLAGPVGHVIVVVGSDRARIEEALAGRAVRLITNPQPESEMLASVRCGLQAVPPSCSGVLIVLGDQPCVTADVIVHLVQAFENNPKGLVMPVHRGRRGHPLLVAARYREEIMRRYDGVGLRGLIESHADDVAEVAFSEASVVEDMDTPEDYQRIVGETRAQAESDAGR